VWTERDEYSRVVRKYVHKCGSNSFTVTQRICIESAILNFCVMVNH
jgi:hypothetical protein